MKNHNQQIQYMDAETTEKMKTDYRLRGLSSPRSGTLELLDSDKTTFWVPFNIPEDRYKALFNWAKEDDTFWKIAWIAEVEHESYSTIGCPIGNAQIVAVREWDLNYKPWDK